MNKPTKEQIEQWVSALRSGKYKQTKGALQNQDGYCCLGVACDLFIPQYKLDCFTNLDGSLEITGEMPRHQQHAPDWLREISDDFNLLTGCPITTLNDGSCKDIQQLTFDEIADLLEAVYILEVLN